MSSEKIGRNDTCPCGSNKKYKKCCIASIIPIIKDTEPGWYQIRVAEGNVIDRYLVPYMLKTCGRDIGPEVLFRLCLGEDLKKEELELFTKSMLKPWMFFDWQVNVDELGKDFSGPTIALQYLEEFRSKLTYTEQRFIELMSESYYSFYLVIGAVSGVSLTLKDVFLQTEYTVKEFQGSQTLTQNNIIYTRIITYSDTSIMVGCAPLTVPPTKKNALIDYKKELELEIGLPLTGQLLRKHEAEIRASYFMFIREKTTFELGI